MKSITQLSIIIACAMLSVGGCATTSEYRTPANAQTATSILCHGVLSLAVNPADRVEIANYIYSIAHAVRTLSGGKVPTPEEMKATIKLFTPNGDKWADVGQAIAGVWAGIYPQVKGNSKLAFEYIEAIATGAENAARPFLTPKPTP